MKCYECEGFGHIKTKYHTFLKKPKNGLSNTWFESDDESGREIVDKVLAFTVSYDYYSESSDEEMSVEELAETYRELLTEWKEYCLRKEKQKKTISAILLEKQKFGSTIAGLEEEVTLLKSKLENIKKIIRMLNSGSDTLDEILEIRENKAIGFDYSSMNKKVKFPTKKFLTPEKKTEFLIKDHMSQHPAQHV